MKLNRFTYLLMAGLAFAACSDIDEIQPQGGTLLATQVQEANNAAPSRTNATFNGMYTLLGEPLSIGFSSARPDNFGFIMMAISNDMEAADIPTANNNYNWFSPCMEWSTRNGDYANPYIRYAVPYNEIAAANDVIKALPADSEDPDIRARIAQAKAIRAFSYLNLAPYFQFNYQVAPDEPCIPLVTEETTDFTNNPRASVKAVYEQIIKDLDYAVENLEGYTRPDKSRIDQQVAYGLRARAYLDMGMYAEAAADADKAMAGYTPASMQEVSEPFLYDINEHNWMWGYDMTTTIAEAFPFATSSAWIRSFSEYSYSAGTQTYFCINNILYDKIPDTDVRKGWWVDTNLESPLLDHVTWDGYTGAAVSTYENDDKKVFLPYTNVKFGMFTYGGDTNEEDWPFMRVEEMILIKAEGLAKTAGKEADGRKVLEDFVKTYRDPNYNSLASGRTLADEIWYQRRVELWGEGFANSDVRRLNKPVVRFHGGKESNFPEAFRFNVAPDDPWMLMRFCTAEMNTNLAIVDNVGGNIPVQDQNPTLRDGVTD